jgi:hypothetical protein
MTHQVDSPAISTKTIQAPVRYLGTLTVGDVLDNEDQNPACSALARRRWPGFETFKPRTGQPAAGRGRTLLNAPASITQAAAHTGISVGTASNLLNRQDTAAKPTRGA